MRKTVKSWRGYAAPILIATAWLVAVTGAATVYLYGALRHARLGLIDDHEILRFLGPDGLAPVQVLGVLFSDTEVGQWGEGTRLRPVYYLIRLIETAAFGDRAGLWYLTRMLVLVLVASGFGFIALRALYTRGDSTRRLFVATAAATLVALLVVTIPSWTDIGTRLGPSEVYVGLGIAIFAIGGFELWCRPGANLGWIVTTVGYLVIAGSKEDGLLFAVPLAVLFVLCLPAAKSRWLPIAMAALSLVFTVYIALGIVVGSAGTGEDMYGNGRSLQVFVDYLWGNPYLFGVLLCLAIAIVVDILAARNRPVSTDGTRSRFAAARRSLVARPHTLAVAVAVYLVVGDLYFYQNYLEHWQFVPARYGFVSEVALLFAVLVVFVGVAPVIVRLRLYAVGVVMAVLLAVSPLGAQIGVAFADYRALSARTTDSSVAVDTQIQTAAAELQADPEAQVVLLVDQAIDYERVFALPEFLSFYAGVDSVFIDVDIPSEDSGENQLTIDLSERLVEMETSGKTGSGWRVSPDSGLDPDAQRVCFAFNGGPSYALADQCDSLHLIG